MDKTTYHKLYKYLTTRKGQLPLNILTALRAIANSDMPPETLYFRAGLVLHSALTAKALTEQEFTKAARFIEKRINSLHLTAAAAASVRVTCAIPIVCSDCGTRFAAISRQRWLPPLRIDVIGSPAPSKYIAETLNITDYPSRIVSMILESGVILAEMEPLRIDSRLDVETVAMVFAKLRETGWHLTEVMDLELFWSKHVKPSPPVSPKSPGS